MFEEYQLPLPPGCTARFAGLALCEMKDVCTWALLVRRAPMIVYPPYVMGQYCEYAVAYLVALTPARIPYDAERSAGLHNGSAHRAGGAGRSANAVPRISATAQRGHRGLETGDEGTAIGALRSVISCLLSCGSDAQVRR